MHETLHCAVLYIASLLYLSWLEILTFFHFVLIHVLVIAFNYGLVFRVIGTFTFLVRFEAFTVLRMMMLFFWILAPCRAEDGDNMFLRNAGVYRRVYMAPKPRTISSFIYLLHFINFVPKFDPYECILHSDLQWKLYFSLSNIRFSSKIHMMKILL
jgi:hypothetical protein